VPESAQSTAQLKVKPVNIFGGQVRGKAKQLSIKAVYINLSGLSSSLWGKTIEKRW